jgi:hypothetical protein
VPELAKATFAVTSHLPRGEQQAIDAGDRLSWGTRATAIAPSATGSRGTEGSRFAGGPGGRRSIDAG